MNVNGVVKMGIWEYFGGILRVHSSPTLGAACPAPSEGSAVISPNATCLQMMDEYQPNLPPKFAAAFGVNVYRVHPLPALITMSVAVVDRFSVTVTVTMQGDYGNLFCKARSRGKTPKDNNELLLKYDYNRAWKATSKPTVLTFGYTGLLPSTSYTMFCLVTDTDTSVADSFSNVLSKGQSFTTPCCRSLNIIQSPAAVYGYFAKYSTPEFSALGSSAYLFTFQLSSAPESDAIVVTPTTSDARIAVVPSSITFSPNSNSIVGQFFLNATNLPVPSISQLQITLGVANINGGRHLLMITI